jgi:hypothetical protein
MLSRYVVNFPTIIPERDLWKFLIHSSVKNLILRDIKTYLREIIATSSSYRRVRERREAENFSTMCATLEVIV